MDTSITTRLDRIEHRLRFYRFAFFCSLAFIALAISSRVIGSPDADDILRVKGLIIEDVQGRPRIVLGAPIPLTSGRKRTDALTGIVYLDSSGIDRLTIGREPDPMTAEGIKPRRVGGVGILIHDKEGVERGGYGVLDDQTAILTLDWPKSGEAVAISSNEQLSAVGLFHRSEPGSYREALTVGVMRKGEQSFVKVTDANDVQRLRLQTVGSEEPVIQRFDTKGEEISSAPLTGP